MPAATSYLFVPGNRPDRFDKALAADAGCVIIDLEDAVPTDGKAAAREALGGWLSTTSLRVAVRVNAADTPWFDDDLAVCASPNVYAIMLPKADNGEDLAACANAAGQARLLPLIETATGFDAPRKLAAVPGVAHFVFGSIDFQLDMGISGEGDELLFFRSRLVLASRLGRLLPPVDGVTTETRDVEKVRKVRSDAARARRLGFGAKLCIHPAQVAPVNAAFRPTRQETDWARKVLEVFAAAGGAAATVEGRMIDRPVVLKAQAILDQDAQASASA